MSKSIKISEKHGVNPTMPLCFFCGEEKNEIVLLGKLPGDVEAPRHMWMPGDYEPCPACQEKWDIGIAMIEVTDHENFANQPPIFEDNYPTGRVGVLKEEFVNKIFTPETAEALQKRRHGLLETSMFEKLMPKKE